LSISLDRTLAVAAAALVAGCASMGEGGAPAAAPRSADALAAKDTLAEAPLSPAAWPDEEWWRAFGDAQLDRLIAEALAGSPSLREASARTRRAVALAGASEASLYPRVDAHADVSRRRFPEHGVTPPPVAGTWHTVYQVDASLAWQPDLWGGNRAAYEAALGRARAAEVGAHAARLALTSAVALAYAQLEHAFLELDVARASLDDRRRLLALTRQRNAAGIDSALELKQAEAALPSARERIERLEERIELKRHQLAALLGEGPDRGAAIARPVANGMAVLALPSRMPAELLGRRPDLVARRWRVEAALQDVAAAKARFYPNIDLFAVVGLQSLGEAGLLSAASRSIAAGPALSLPIFDGGRLRAGLAGSKADYEIAVEQYNQALADALRDVADQLSSFRSVQAQGGEQRQALATAQEAYQLALARYREGIGNYLQVLSAEAPVLEQRALAADLHARQLSISINLMRALGGGYQPASLARAKQAGDAVHDR
jgi:NodT family efflux transporter outer membrane factor (OMF) lipoprotein